MTEIRDALVGQVVEVVRPVRLGAHWQAREQTEACQAYELVIDGEPYQRRQSHPSRAPATGTSLTRQGDHHDPS